MLYEHVSWRCQGFLLHSQQKDVLTWYLLPDNHSRTRAACAAAGPGLCVCAQDGDDVGQAGVSKLSLHLAASCVNRQGTQERIWDVNLPLQSLWLWGWQEQGAMGCLSTSRAGGDLQGPLIHLGEQ